MFAVQSSRVLLLILCAHAISSVCTLTTPASSPRIPLDENSLRSVYRELNSAVVERIAATANTNDRYCSDHNHRLPIIHIDELLQTPNYENTRMSQGMLNALERGFCVVDASNTPHSERTLKSMWGAVREDLPHDTADKSSSMLYESLQREQVQTNDGGGYDYIHFSPEHNSRSETTFGIDSLEALRSSYELLSEISVAFVSRCISHHHRNQDMTEQLVKGWMSLPESSFQRFARYRPVSSSSTYQENLRPHCDWSLVTLIPISDVPGLEIYCHDLHGDNSCWIRPEEAFSSGVVVLAGKWLEILTPPVESTIHRVVVEQDIDSPRWSAPYFFRLDGETLLLEKEGGAPHVDPLWSLQRKLVEIQRQLLLKLYYE